MKKRIVAAIALGGAALFVVPASVAYAVSAGDDSRPGMFNNFGSHGAQSRGNDGMNAPESGPRADRNSDRSADRQPGVGPMRDEMLGGPQGGMGGSSLGNQGMGNQGMGNQGMGNQGMAQSGIHTPGMGWDPAALVEPGSTLNTEEIASLTYMVEEEKLAHDLYVELGDAWNLPVFDNIAAAETQHGDAVGALLDAYSVENPTTGMSAGEFANPTLQELYDSLLHKGLASSTAALEACGLVEEMDIADLRDRTSTNVAIDQVFGQLEAGSEHHLRAFATNLERLGVSYDAQVLSSSDVARMTGQ